MKVRIIKASQDSYWYAPCIDTVFEVGSSATDGYYSILDNPACFINEEDCVVVEEQSGNGDPAYLALLERMKELHIAKNAGYSGDSADRWANFRMSEGFGVSPFIGVMVRMSGKFIRIQNLVKNPKNEKVGESIRDTLMDLASYALIAICLLDEKVQGE